MAGEKNVFRKERRAHGEGSIYQRKDGTWAGVVRYEDPETGEKKKHFVYGKTRKEAANKKKDFEDKLEKGIVPKTEKITVGKWLDDWLEIYARVRVRQNTFEGYQRIVNGHLKPDLGKIKINDLKPRHVQKMLNEKLERGNKRTGGPLGPRQVEYIYAVLHMALEQAVKDNIITRNVCDAVDKPQKVTKTEFMPWTVEQTNQFLCQRQR
jgi:integrase